jgi:hypothetical protein
MFIVKESLKVPKGGSQNPEIEERQTTLWPKEKEQAPIFKTLDRKLKIE